MDGRLAIENTKRSMMKKLMLLSKGRKTAIVMERMLKR